MKVKFYWSKELTGRDFSWINYLAVLSAHKFISDQIVIVVDKRPEKNEWFDKACELSVNLIIEFPGSIEGVEASLPIHRLDKYRIQDVCNEPIISLSLDTIFLFECPELRTLQSESAMLNLFDVGEKDQGLSSNIMISNSDNPIFLNRVRRMYDSMYFNDCEDLNGMATKLSVEHEDELGIIDYFTYNYDVSDYIFRPGYTNYFLYKSTPKAICLNEHIISQRAEYFNERLWQNPNKYSGMIYSHLTA